MSTRARGALALAAGTLALAACTPEPVATSATTATTAAGATSTGSAPVVSGSSDPYPAGPDLAAATATPADVLAGLSAPWDLAFLPSGAVLVTLRDLAQVLMLTADGTVPVTGPGADELVADTTTDGEAGLLGVEVSPGFATDHLVYLYRTTSADNRVVRAELAADGTLGPLEPVLGGIPRNSFHDGGRLAFGPDGYLYVTTGDAGDRALAQDVGSLAGKILRLTPDGDPAPGNPVAGNPMWSYGHRNVQGVGWDPSGRMYASEFGQDTADELNVIEPGANYGWPTVEGIGNVAGLVDPVVTWPTDDASPSGIAVTADAVYLAALRGERLWQVPASDGVVGEPRVALDGLGRLRDVELGPDGALWILTNNTDGRGTPRTGDDRVLRLAVP